MKTLEYIGIFVFAGLIALTVKYFASKGQHILAGVLVMIPINTVMNYSLICAKEGVDGVDKKLRGSAIGAVAILPMLVVLNFASKAIPFWCAMLLAIATWALCAYLLKQLP